MTRQELDRASLELIPMEGTAIVYMLFVEEVKQTIQIAGQNDPKGTDFATMLRRVHTNPNQAVVVSSDIPGVKKGDIIYINHRYYPYPMIHYGKMFHRIMAADIVAVLHEEVWEVDRRMQLKKGLARTWTDEPVELTRKDVLT